MRLRPWGPDRIERQGLLENRGNPVLKVSGVLGIEKRGEELAAQKLKQVPAFAIAGTEQPGRAF